MNVARELRHFRRKVRRATRWRSWPVSRQVAVGVWIPILVLAFIVGTGPHSSSASVTAARTAAAAASQWTPPSTLDPSLLRAAQADAQSSISSAGIAPAAAPGLSTGGFSSAEQLLLIERAQAQQRALHTNWMSLKLTRLETQVAGLRQVVLGASARQLAKQRGVLTRWNAYRTR